MFTLDAQRSLVLSLSRSVFLCPGDLCLCVLPELSSGLLFIIDATPKNWHRPSTGRCRS
ncbi:hypothetical protein KI387_009012, partial [Taxus chinensis]